MTNRSYVTSHTAPGKGRSYDHIYQTDPWHVYMWSSERRVLSTILADFFAGRPAHLLDFACGTGRITAFLEDKVETSTALDVSESMLEVARAKLRRTDLRSCDMLKEDSFPGRRFNLITAFRFFVNAEPELRKAAARALAARLTADGLLVFNNHQNADAPYTRASNGYARLRSLPEGNTLSMAQCRTLMADVGLEIVRVYPVGSLHLPKINLLHAFYRTADRVAGWSSILANHSESPVMVARRMSGGEAGP